VCSKGVGVLDAAEDGLPVLHVGERHTARRDGDECINSSSSGGQWRDIRCLCAVCAECAVVSVYRDNSALARGVDRGIDRYVSLSTDPSSALCVLGCWLACSCMHRLLVVVSSPLSSLSCIVRVVSRLAVAMLCESVEMAAISYHSNIPSPHYKLQLNRPLHDSSQVAQYLKIGCTGLCTRLLRCTATEC